MIDRLAIYSGSGLWRDRRIFRVRRVAAVTERWCGSRRLPDAEARAVKPTASKSMRKEMGFNVMVSLFVLGPLHFNLGGFVVLLLEGEHRFHLVGSGNAFFFRHCEQ